MLFYSSEPRLKTLQNQFVFPDAATTIMGDGVVVRDDILIPGMKWSWEYDNGHKNAKPVKIVDSCSIYPRDQSRKD